MIGNSQDTKSRPFHSPVPLIQVGPLPQVILFFLSGRSIFSGSTLNLWEQSGHPTDPHNQQGHAGVGCILDTKPLALLGVSMPDSRTLSERMLGW